MTDFGVLNDDCDDFGHEFQFLQQMKMIFYACFGDEIRHDKFFIDDVPIPICFMNFFLWTLILKLDGEIGYRQ